MNVLLLGDDPATLSVTASIGAGAGRAMDVLYNNAKAAALAAGRSPLEAAAAGQAAVDAYKTTIVSSAQSRIAQAAAEGEARRLQAIIASQAAQAAAVAQANSSNVEADNEPAPSHSIIPIALGISALAYFMFKG